MPRLILELAGGARTADVRASVMSVPAVADAVEARQSNAVIVTVSELTADVRSALANQPGVVAVHEDLQALPQVADRGDVEDFLNRVRDLRGEEEVPPPIETEPTRTDDNLRTDGGGPTFLPADADEQLEPLVEGPIADTTASVTFAGAPVLHERGIRGGGVIAVVLDTGICADAFRQARLLDGADLTDEDNPTEPLSGHGTMSAGIMAGDETTPGIGVGFLPDADIFPIKTTLAASEILLAQDIIVDLANETGRPVIVNNSWGFPECRGICAHPITGAIGSAANHPAVTQVLAAGNSGVECGERCDGTTPGINGPNSLSSVITVGASGRNGDPETMQVYSSRGGPGAVACGSAKPDLTAPVYGTVPWGCGSKDMGNNGGTSAACPMVSGAAGLIADARGALPTDTIRSGLHTAAEQFVGSGFNGCSGAGNLDAAGALSMTPEGAAASGIGDTFSVATVGVSFGLLGAALRRRTQF